MLEARPELNERLCKYDTYMAEGWKKEKDFVKSFRDCEGWVPAVQAVLDQHSLSLGLLKPSELECLTAGANPVFGTPEYVCLFEMHACR